MNNNIKKLLVTFSPLMLVLLFNLFIFNRYFPLTEGWWETYGYFINNGLKLHQDLDFALSPLFIYLSAFLLKVTDNSYFDIRLIGVFTFSLTVFLLQQFLRNFFPPFSSAIAAIFAAFLFISSPQFIAKDYHTYVNLMTVLWLLLLVKSVNRQKESTSVIMDFSLGALLVVIFFFKQNVGVLLLFALMAHFLISCPFRLGIARLMGVLTGFVLVFLVFQAFPGFDLSLLKGNDAKGSIGTVLFRFITLEPNRRAFVLAITFAFLSVYLKNGLIHAGGTIGELIKKFFPQSINSSMAGEVKWIFAAVIIMAVGTLRGIWMQSIIPVALSVLFIHFLRYLFSRTNNSFVALSEPQRAVILPLCALAYANTNTAPVDFIGMFEVIAYATAAVVAVSGLISTGLRKFVVTLLLLTVSLFVIMKVVRPYEWWGNIQGNIISATHEVAYPELKGIYMDEPTQRAFNITKENIERYSTSDNDVYMFNLPIFYQLEHKKIFGRLPVHWFDVVTDTQIEADYQNIRTKRPSIIVMYEPDSMAFKAHKELKNVEELTQEGMIRQVEQWAVRGEYVFVESVALFPTADADKYDKNSLEMIQANVLLLNPMVNGKSLEEIALLIGSETKNVDITGIVRNINGFGIRINPEDKLRLKLGDYLVLRGQRKNVVEISEKLGLAKGAGREWNTVTIYARKDRYNEKNSAFAEQK